MCKLVDRGTGKAQRHRYRGSTELAIPFSVTLFATVFRQATNQLVEDAAKFNITLAMRSALLLLLSGVNIRHRLRAHLPHTNEQLLMLWVFASRKVF